MRTCILLAILVCSAGCGIDSEPILGSEADAEAGNLAPDAGAPPLAAFTPYMGCDQTRECEADCPEDLDCANDEGDRVTEPEALSLAEPASHSLAADEEGWWDMAGWGDGAVLGFEMAAGTMVVAVYDGETLIGRSAPGESGVVFDAADGAPILVRAVAGPDGAEFSFFQR